MRVLFTFIKKYKFLFLLLITGLIKVFLFLKRKSVTFLYSIAL